MKKYIIYILLAVSLNLTFCTAPLEEEPQSSIDYRNQLNSQGSPSETVAAGYIWRPGTELSRKVVNL